MILTLPYPEEIHIGHLGRTAYLNLQPDLTSVLRKIKEKSANKISDDAKECSEPDVLGIPSRRYFLQHSLDPFNHFVATVEADSHYYDIWKPEHILRDFRVPRDQASFCMACMEEDEFAFGTSYWHRSHQALGIEFCATHKSPLCVVKDKSAFLSNPRSWLDQNSALRGTAFVRGPLDASKIRYAEVVQAMLLRTQKACRYAVADQISSKALNHQTPDGKGRLKPCAYRTVKAFFPKEWLHKYFPELTQTGRGKPAGWHYVNGARWGRADLTGKHYALVLASHFGGDAISVVERTDAPLQKKSVDTVWQKRHKERTKQLRNRIISSYFLNFGLGNKVAKDIGVSAGAMYQSLQQIGIPFIRGTYHLEKRKRIMGLAVAIILSAEAVHPDSIVNSTSYEALIALVIEFDDRAICAALTKAKADIDLQYKQTGKSIGWAAEHNRAE